MDPGEELVDVVDDGNEVVGVAARRTVRDENLLHRCTYVFVLNAAGELYIHRRTDTKDVYPGFYDVGAGGVNAAGESYEECARRELEEELGVSAEPVFRFLHRYEGPSGRVWGGAFDVGVRGGRVARLFQPDGDYWYYAHLSDWNSTLESGSQVELGDVIGYCGNTGDAVGGPTHVHFGHYLPSGQALDTMSDLIGWLEAAERRAGVTERGAEAARSTTTVVPTYPHELGAEPPVTVTVSNPVVTAGLSTSTAGRPAAPSATDVLALAVVVAARLLLIPGRRVARRLGSLRGRGTG